jgi:N-dimethylarginine dimethylaminohydrolase
METSAVDLLGHRYPVNGVPFTEPDTENRTFLMPVYSSPEPSSPSPSLERNCSALERHGYRVIPVPTTADKNYGGIHCLAQVIR